MTKDDELRLEYFQKHAIPWQIEHIKFRGLGIQFFMAAQALLFVAWVSKPAPVLSLFGLFICASFWAWDARNRYIIGAVHELGKKLADAPLFGVGESGEPLEGVHLRFARTLQESGMLWSGYKAIQSHTWAIRFLFWPAVVAWLVTLFLPELLQARK